MRSAPARGGPDAVALARGRGLRPASAAGRSVQPDRERRRNGAAGA